MDKFLVTVAGTIFFVSLAKGLTIEWCDQSSQKSE